MRCKKIQSAIKRLYKKLSLSCFGAENELFFDEGMI
jgi:hypothetical protein